MLKRFSLFAILLISQSTNFAWGEDKPPSDTSGADQTKQEHQPTPAELAEIRHRGHHPKPGTAGAHHDIPNEQLVLGVSNLTATQKAEIQAIFKAQRQGRRPTLAKIQTQLNESGRSIARGNELKAEAKAATQAEVARQAKKKANAAYNDAVDHRKQIRTLVDQDQQRRMEAWTKIRAVLTTAQLKAFDEKTRGAYIPSQPQPQGEQSSSADESQ